MVETNVSLTDRADAVPPNDTTFHLSLRFTPPRTGVYVLRVAPLPGEATVANNERPFAVTVVPEQIRVFLDDAVPGWEYRHVRHALARDPAVALVANAAAGEVVVRPTGQTWRLEAAGDDVFQQYWSDRVRAEARRIRHLTPLPPPPVSEEWYALGRNDALLAEIARVSGGEFLAAPTGRQLAAALTARPRAEPRRFDLRDAWWALLVTAGGLIISWARRPFPGTA